ncbi:MAG: DNA polymerase III subunit beta [Elusimicrobiota bacterium]|jgi:DNA polymerase-3 subunit beta|nr:DNA polymerase III subunit beta [Elusimicrobiota bacterium]
MKVICTKEILIKGIQTVSPVAASKTALPVLSNFLFETKGDKIKLSATDLEIAVQCHIKGEILEEGSITIPAKRFADIIKELPQDAEIEIKADEVSNQINIKSGKSKFNLMGISVTEYPKIPDFPKENNFSISKDIFIDMLKKTVFAVSKDSQRFVLTGVYFVIENGTLKMAATDGRRLAYIMTEGIDAKVKNKAIVPSRAISDIIRLFSSDIKDETIKVGLSENRCAVEIDDITFLSTLVEGIFPNYEQVIPKKSDISVRINVKETLAAVRQMSLLTGDKMTADRSSCVKFAFDKNILKVSASTAGVGSGETEMEIEYNNEATEISFNPTFVKEVLQNIDTEWAIFEFSNSINPSTLTPENNKNYLCVVMPMRV